MNEPLGNSIARGFDSHQFHFSASVAEGLGTGLIIRSTLVQVQSDVIFKNFKIRKWWNPVLIDYRPTIIE